MTEPHEAPAETAPEPSTFERMKDFTRRLLNVPKSEIVPPKPPRERKKS